MQGICSSGEIEFSFYLGCIPALLWRCFASMMMVMVMVMVMMVMMVMVMVMVMMMMVMVNTGSIRSRGGIRGEEGQEANSAR